MINSNIDIRFRTSSITSKRNKNCFRVIFFFKFQRWQQIRRSHFSVVAVRTCMESFFGQLSTTREKRPMCRRRAGRITGNAYYYKFATGKARKTFFGVRVFVKNFTYVNNSTVNIMAFRRSLVTRHPLYHR